MELEKVTSSVTLMGKVTSEQALVMIYWTSEGLEVADSVEVVDCVYEESEIGSINITSFILKHAASDSIINDISVLRMKVTSCKPVPLCLHRMHLSETT